MSDLQQRHPPDLPRKMRLGRHPRVARAEELEISDIRHRLTRLQDITRIERLEHCRQAAEMVEMRVRRDDRGQLGRAVTPQKRHDDTPAGIPPWPARPTIDQDPTPRRTAQRYRVALADV